MLRGGELRDRVAAHLLSGRVRRGHPQQRADGLLHAAARGQRRAPPRDRDAAAARQRVARALQRRARRARDPRGLSRPAPHDRAAARRDRDASGRCGPSATSPTSCGARVPSVPAAESLVRVGALDGLGITEAGRPPTRDEMLALLPELKAVLAREGVAGDDTLCLAPAPARPPEDPSTSAGGARRGASRRSSSSRGSRSPRTRSSSRAATSRRAASRGRATCARCRTAPACGWWACASGRRRRARARASARASSRWRTRPGCSTSWSSATRSSASGETIVKHRAYLVDGMLQNNCERGLAIVADTVKPYVVRAEATASACGCAEACRAGPMGPSLGGAGAAEEESWDGRRGAARSAVWRERAGGSRIGRRHDARNAAASMTHSRCPGRHRLGVRCRDAATSTRGRNARHRPRTSRARRRFRGRAPRARGASGRARLVLGSASASKSS